MRRLFKKATVVILSTALLMGTVLPHEYADAASKNAAKASITVKPGAKTLYIGWKEKKKTTSLKVKYTNIKKKSVSFKSSNKKVLKVSQKGKITAVKAGNAYVTATLKEDKKVNARVKIAVKNYQMAFASKSLTITLEGNSATTSKNLVLYGTQKSAQYSSSNEDVLERKATAIPLALDGGLR